MGAGKTMSTSRHEPVRGTHVLSIIGYSKHRGMGLDSSVSSGTFSVGGHDWYLLFVPDGIDEPNRDCITLLLILLDIDESAIAKVRASCDLRFVNQSTGESFLEPNLQGSVRKFNGRKLFSVLMHKNRSEFEATACIHNDCLVVECTVTVITQPQVSKTRLFPKIEVPPSDFTAHFGKLLEQKERVDVKFSVGGETFAAHKLVLAARSPVFEAELYGPMREATEQHVTIDDMQPDVFRDFLHFIYTDSLPEIDDYEADDDSEMIRHLLVAADRYAMDRLKLICQSIICENLNVETVAAALAFADQYNCDSLKDACVEFIACSHAMDAVMATEGYKNLKRTCPSVLVDAFERTTKLRKM